MIGYLHGRVVRSTGDQAVVETGGVGYLVSVPATAREKVCRVGATVELHIHTQVREDQLALFGFTTPEELELFEMLIQVDGVGPKAGLAILSAAGLDTLKRAILAGDADPVRRASGVGPRTAQKVIIDLRPKLEAESALASLPAPTTSTDGEVASQVEAALRGLGFAAPEAKQGLKAIDWSANPTAQEALTRALQALGRDRP